jgi:hypothetical protein
MENYAIIPTDKELGFKNRNLRDFSQVKQPPKPSFDYEAQATP